MTRQRSLITICIACILAVLAGCKQESSTPIEPVQTSLLTYQPKGTISGLIKNAVTAAPVAGAVISVGYEGGVQSTTSNGAGAYSFANVPAGQYQIVNGTAVATGTYIMTVSLVDYNAKQTDATKKYRDYYYSQVTIKFTSLAPGDSLAVSDLVGATHLDISYLNTTVQGLVVDQNQQPVANAMVMLYDATVVPNVMLGQTISASNGAFVFTAIDNGLTITLQARSNDGSLQGTLAGFTLPANVLSDSLRSQVVSERIQITPADNVPPKVIALSPENLSDVSPNNLQVVYTFSEPIKQTAYTRTDLPQGSSTILDDITVTYVGLKKTATAINYSAQWNASFTQLTLTPQGIVGSAKYTVSAVAAFGSGKITDLANNVLTNNALITGDFEVLQFTTSGGSTVPGAPTVSRRNVAGVFNSLDYTGGVVGLEWNYDANARSYNIYKSVNGGSYNLVASNVFALQATDNSGSLVIPIGATDPLSSGNVKYIVRAESKDLVEGPASNPPIIVSDQVKPRMLASTSVASAGSTNSWLYTVRFSEPMTIADAENIANYTFTTTGGVTFTLNTANYLGSSGGSYAVQLGVTTSAALPVGYSLVVSNIKDLAGNNVDQTANSKTF